MKRRELSAKLKGAAQKLNLTSGMANVVTALSDRNSVRMSKITPKLLSINEDAAGEQNKYEKSDDSMSNNDDQVDL